MLNNPKQIAHYEISWWKAHHNKDYDNFLENFILHQAAIFDLNVELISSSAIYLVQAALVDADKPHDQRDLKTSIKLAADYYRALQKHVKIKFDPLAVAKKEVGWWKIHDDLEEIKDKTRLSYALASWYSSIFSVPVEQLLKPSRFKAKATYEHDLAEIANISSLKSDLHWNRAEENLVKHYDGLKKVITR